MANDATIAPYNCKYCRGTDTWHELDCPENIQIDNHEEYEEQFTNQN